jgi:uncharacterized lipoprotein YddW (UPF0748 family)
MARSRRASASVLALALSLAGARAAPPNGAIGHYPSLQALESSLLDRARRGEPLDRALDDAEVALELDATSQELADRGRLAEAAAAHEESLSRATRALYRSFCSKPGELRGVWTGYSGRPTWRDTCRRLAAAHFNAVYPWMLSAGAAFYPSKILPVHDSVRDHGDYLAEAVAAAHANGLEIHARVLALFLYRAAPDTRAALQEQSRLMKTAAGKYEPWLCPSNPVNRRMVVQAVAELVTKYPVDGIQFDYLRYPSDQCCVCWACRQQFEAKLGHAVSQWPQDVMAGAYKEAYLRFRQEQLSSLLGEMVGAARRARPDLIVSAAVLLNWEEHRREFGQDWLEWIDRDLVDYVCPMDYTGDDERFAGWVKRQVAWVGGKVPLCVGIGPFADGVAFRGPGQTARQIELSRELGGDGFVIFEYTPALAEKHLPALAEGATSTPARLGLGAPRVRFALAGGEARAGVQRVKLSAVLEQAGLGAGNVEFRVHAATGWQVAPAWDFSFGALRSEGSTLLSRGRYRLVVEGDYLPALGQTAHFCRWGPVFEVPLRPEGAVAQ